MARALDVLVRTYAAPVLMAGGWSRSGRVFRLASPEGDATRLSFSETKLGLGDGLVRFVISAQLGPSPLVRFLRQDGAATGTASAPQQHEMFQLGRFPFEPPEALRVPWDQQVWRYDPQTQSEICGTALAEAIGRGAPWLRQLLDPELMLEAVLSQSVSGSGVSSDDPAAATLLCLMDRLPKPEVESLLAQIPDQGPYLSRVRKFVIHELASR